MAWLPGAYTVPQLERIPVDEYLALLAQARVVRRMKRNTIAQAVQLALRQRSNSDSD